MARYIGFPLETNPFTLVRRAYTYLQARMPGWTPAAGNLDVWLLEAVSTELAELVDVASRVPDTVFRYFGSPILGVNPIVAASATTTTTWTMRDAAGYTIPAGTQVGIRNANGVLIPFKTINTVVVPPGSTVTAAGAIGIIAVNPGADGSLLGSVGGTVELIDILDYVTPTGIVMVTATNGGADAETDAQYLDRLVNEIRLFTQTPILAKDFANLVVLKVAGVYRATALDGYNPTNDTFNNERMVTVVAIDQNGNDVSAPIKTTMDALLQSLRETNFDVRIMSPTVTQIDVTVTVKSLPGFTTAQVQANVIAALQAYLKGSNWGQALPNTDGSADPHSWVNQTTLRQYELATVINETDGVDYIVGNVTFAKHGNALATTDVTLDGRVSLPQYNTLTVTAT